MYEERGAGSDQMRWTDIEQMVHKVMEYDDHFGALRERNHTHTF